MTTDTVARRPKMTEAEARSFERYSVANAVTVKRSLACGCQPYEDVFTFRRWIALGQVVERGQKAIKIPTIITTEDKDTGEVRRLFHTSAVFCRHQVKETSK